jgi:hypothetical protein
VTEGDPRDAWGYLRWHRADPWVLWGLTALALLSRMLWVLWIHPPGDYVFSDMAGYVARATSLATDGFVWGRRDLAWQAWGTDYLLALPLWLFGPRNLPAAAVLWGLLGAAAVPLAYLVALRVVRWRPLATAVGMLCLLWYPNLTTTGFFLSEPPFLCFQLASTYGLLRVLQEGRWGWFAGIASALAFAIRPQAALFFVLVFGIWVVLRRKLPHVRWPVLARVSVPLIAMLAFSLLRFTWHTGYCCGVAENANMNLTAGRCHNIVTQAFPTREAMDRSIRARSTRDGRRVSLPGYRILSNMLPPSHPLALRPALGGETIKLVGYIGDPNVHKAIRADCYAKTGLIEQARYSLVNVSLLWFFAEQWPDLEPRSDRPTFFAYAFRAKRIFLWVFWLPTIVGVGWALTQLWRRPAVVVVASLLINSWVIAAIFFGTIRLRSPYDPYAFILSLEVAALVVLTAQQAIKRRRAATMAAADGETTGESGGGAGA